MKFVKLNLKLINAIIEIIKQNDYELIVYCTKQ